MKIMAVDYGEARTGLAMCDRTEFLASPVGVIKERALPKTVEKIVFAAKEYGAEMIVLGYPKNMDGSIGEKAQNCEKIAVMLRNLTQLPVELWDERQTTKEATIYLNETNVRGKKRKEVIDELAATIILESYLAYRKNHIN